MLKDMQKQELMTLKFKGSRDPGTFGTAVLLLNIEYGHNLIEEDKVAAPVWTVASKYVNGIFNKRKLIESKDKEVTCEALVTVCRGSWRLNEAGKSAEMKEK